MMTHDEASELLGAYGLDAVDGDERTQLEEHLESCPRCRAELDGVREVAAAMGNSVEPLPEGLWSHIAVRLPERHEDEEPPPMPRLRSESRATFRAPDSSRRRRRRRRPTRALVSTVAGIAVAAAAVAVLLGIGLVRADNTNSNLRSAQAGRSSTVTAALHTPGHRLITLDSGSHTALAHVVVVPSGQGYLVSSKLPSLENGRTYQLWAVEGPQPISLGLLGASPRQAAFTMAGSTRPTRLSITAEPPGGSVVPTAPIIATGTV
jgi:anti-sigma-K factor RskA